VACNTYQATRYTEIENKQALLAWALLALAYSSSPEDESKSLLPGSNQPRSMPTKGEKTKSIQNQIGEGLKYLLDDRAHGLKLLDLADFTSFRTQLRELEIKGP